MGIRFKKISWILDADIRGYFDSISHDWMIRFLEHRVADQPMLRLIRKWLKAGVIEQVVVGHLAGQFADGGEAQVDRRRGETLGEQPAAVGVCERF